MKQEKEKMKTRTKSNNHKKRRNGGEKLRKVKKMREISFEDRYSSDCSHEHACFHERLARFGPSAKTC